MAVEYMVSSWGYEQVPLADASVTEWREHRRMTELLEWQVPLADASVTEWRYDDFCRTPTCSSATR